MRHLIWFISVIALFLLIPHNATAQIHLTATLSGDAEVPPVAVPTEGRGGGVFTLNADSTELTYIIGVSISTLTGPIANAHFHNAPAGVALHRFAICLQTSPME